MKVVVQRVLRAKVSDRKPQLMSMEKIRLYQKNKKEKEMIKQNALVLEEPKDSLGKKCPLTSAEKVRAYRQRQKNKQIVKLNSLDVEVPHNNFDKNNSEQSNTRLTPNADSSTKIFIGKKHPMTAAERVRAFRQRAKQRNSKSSDKKPPLTPAERMRAYRRRQREKQIIPDTPFLKVQQKSSVNTETLIMYNNCPLTPAERMRAYRQRQREKRVISNTSILKIQQSSYENNKVEQLNNKLSSSNTETLTTHINPLLTSSERLMANHQYLHKKDIQNNSFVSMPHQNISENNTLDNHTIINDSVPSTSAIPQNNCDTSTNKLKYHYSQKNSCQIFEKQFKNSHDIMSKVSSQVTVTSSQMGDICAVRYTNSCNEPLIMVTIYIAPNNDLQNIIEFIREILLVYTIQGSVLLKKNDHETPMILVGDFNVNFELNQSQPLINFFNDEFNLKVENSLFGSSTKYGSTTGTVFSRNVQQLESKFMFPILASINQLSHSQNLNDNKPTK